MLQQTLNGTWSMREVTESRWLQARMPGSVMQTLLEHNLIGDPHWRLNEYEARELFRKDYEFTENFT